MPPTSRHLASRSTRLSLLAALVLGLAGTSAAAQVIDSISPPKGGIGTKVTLTGSGFGPGKPKVQLVCTDQNSDKPFRMRLVSASDTEIQAVVTKALVGPAVVKVVTAGKKGEANVPFDVVGPDAGLVTPNAAGPGEAVTIHGSSFGSKGVKVLFFDQRATLVDASDDSLTVLVPAGLPDGQWAPRVLTPLGTDLADNAVATFGSSAPVPADFVKAQVGALRFSVPATGVNAVITGAKVAFDATVDGDIPKKLSVLVPFNMSTSKVPSVFQGVVSSQPVFFMLSDAQLGSSLWVAMPGLLPWSVSIEGRMGMHLAGTLDAVLFNIAGPGPSELVVKDGQFVVTPHP